MTKKNIKSLIIGLAVILIFGGAYLGINLYTRNQEQKKLEEQQKQAENAIVLSLDPDTLTQISFEGPEGTVLLENAGECWNSPEDIGFVINESKMNLMLNDLMALTATRTLEGVEEKEQYGLGSEAREILITGEGDKSTTLYVGSRNSSNRDLYFQLNADSDVVYMTSSALDSHFFGSLKDYAKYEVFPEVQPSKMRVFQVEKEDGYVLDMPGDDNCTVKDEEGNAQKANLNMVGIMQNNYSNITWMRNVEYNCLDFAQYGLDIPEAVITLEYETEDGGRDSFILSVGTADENGNYYVRLNDSMQVHTIREEYLADFVESKPSSFWSLTYSFVSIGDMEKMEVTSAEGTHTMQRVAENEGTDAETIQWLVDEKQVEKELFTDFYYACVSVTAQERLDEVPQTEEAPVLELHYYLTDGTEKIMKYYEYDQNFYTVVYEDGTKAAHTNKLYVNAMLENLDAMLEGLK